MKFLYNASPIRDIKTLATTLSVSEHLLHTLYSSVADHYTDISILKKDGTFRNINIPKPIIKRLQRLINSRIFCHLSYPDFLYGGIKEKDYHKNALVHADANKIINLDIKSFFPNTKKQDVKRVFKNLLCFPEEVSEYLSEICTLRDSLPQGACTSTHIANLLFFQKEIELFKKFKTQKLTYTRLIDDITISSKQDISQKNITKIISSVQSMIGVKGFELNEAKTKKTTPGNPEDPAKVTGLIVTNNKKVTISAKEASEIEKDVHLCVEAGNTSNYGEVFLKKHNKVSGRVAKLQQIGHKSSSRLRKELRTVMPNLDEDQIKKLKNKIFDIKKKPKGHRSTESYHKYFYEICILLNIYQRTHKDKAIGLRKNLFLYKPEIFKADIKNGLV